MKDVEETGGGSGVPQVVLNQVIPQSFHDGLQMDDGLQSSLGCASVSHLSHMQCSFFTVSIYHCLPVLVYVGRDNAWLNLATLKIKCRAILQVVFFTSKQLYLVMEESRQKEMGVNRLKWILPPFQKWMHIYLNCLIGVGYVNELLISTHALFCYNEVTNQIRTKISL